MRKGIGWPIEAALFYILAAIVWILPVRLASFVGGAVIGTIGPLTPYHKRVLFNIGYAMPETTASERRKIGKGAWWNLGRVIGEFFHIRTLLRQGYITHNGLEHLDPAQGGFLVSAHLGCWEAGSTVATAQHLPVNAVYRASNNPLIALLFKYRSRDLNKIYEKGTEGARGMVKTMKNKEFFCVLVDQKLREGMMLDFFGHKASTPVSHVKIALRMNAPLLMVHVIRTGGCHQQITVSPVDVAAVLGTNPESSEANAALLAGHINQIIEGWIRENPGQWLWQHRRWPASKNEAPPA